MANTERAVPLRGRVPGNTSARVTALPNGRRVVLVRVEPGRHRGALTPDDSATLSEAARGALARRLPLVVVLTSSGADVHQGVAALHGWGQAARAVAECSGIVPICMVVVDLALSGPALLLGLADIVITTSGTVAYLSGPAAVAELTGFQITPTDLGGQHVHARFTGLAARSVEGAEEALEEVAELLDYLPDHTDAPPPILPSADPPSRLTPELADVVPTNPTSSYDVRDIIGGVADDGVLFELRAGWASQLVTALIRIAGQPVGVVANQTQTMAGSLDIAASQKGARFVAFCDAFNVPLLTLVDTSGFMPGKDLEWRGMIRHGAQLVYAYAEATVPRVCLILRKAYGGAYIVMDSKAMGNDLCLAWPTAEVAVMGALPAVQILHRRDDAETQAKLAEDYQERFLNPYVAAERGYVDMVIDPADTRRQLAQIYAVLATKRERLPNKKHGNTPL